MTDPIPFPPFPIVGPMSDAFDPDFEPCQMGGSPHDGECNPKTFCYIHHIHERDLPGDFQACGECFHVWRTVEEFGVDVMRARGEDAARSPSELADENVCPLCTHDF